jgi:hypothetical protein
MTMTNHKLSEKNTMKTNRSLLTLAGAVLACAVLAAPAARAQTVSSLSSTFSVSVVSTPTKVATAGTGLTTTSAVKPLPSMTLAGTVTGSMLFMPNATGGVDSCAYTFTSDGVFGKDAAGNAYKFPAGFITVTRPFAATDHLVMNLALQGPGGITDIYTITLVVDVLNNTTTKVFQGASVSFIQPTNTTITIASAVP